MNNSIFYKIDNQTLKIEYNQNYSSTDNIYIVNGKYIPSIYKNNKIIGIYNLDDKINIFIEYSNDNLKLSTQLNYSLAAEHFTRMTNMQNAEKNIDENLAVLDLEYQRERQENITDELIDVISGAEAMK